MAVIVSATAIEETTAIAAIATIVIGTVVITAIGTGAIGARPARVSAIGAELYTQPPERQVPR